MTCKWALWLQLLSKTVKLSELPRITMAGVVDSHQAVSGRVTESLDFLAKLDGDSLRDRRVAKRCAQVFTKPFTPVSRLVKSADISNATQITLECIFINFPLQFIAEYHRVDPCYIYRYHACLLRRVFLNFNAQSSSAVELSSGDSEITGNITLVTQLHYNRFNILLSLIDNWAGPMQVRANLDRHRTTVLPSNQDYFIRRSSFIYRMRKRRCCAPT